MRDSVLILRNTIRWRFRGLCTLRLHHIFVCTPFFRLTTRVRVSKPSLMMYSTMQHLSPITMFVYTSGDRFPESAAAFEWRLIA